MPRPHRGHTKEGEVLLRPTADHMELAVRRRVRKRDLSFDPQSRDGAQPWDTFQTLAATAAKLGVGFFYDLRNRIVMPESTPSFAERVAHRASVAVPSVT